MNDAGAENCIDEEDFNTTKLQDIIDKCLFDVSMSLIEVKIK